MSLIPGNLEEHLYRGRRNERNRVIALDILSSALLSVEPRRLIRENVRLERDTLLLGEEQINLDLYESIYVIGFGKAAASMAEAIEDILGDRITKGFVNVSYGNTGRTERIKINQAGHPIPDENAIRGTLEIVKLLETLEERDLVLCLISGGGSALLSAPIEGISPEDTGEVTDALLRCGASINEINCIRKHICKVKGGKLARLAFPSKLVSLIISDVVGNPIDIIASGPTVPDNSTFLDAMEIIRRYGLFDAIPASIIRCIERGAGGEIPENPRKGDRLFSGVLNKLIGSGEIAVRAALDKAGDYYFNPLLFSTFVEGEAREAAKVFVAMAREVVNSGNPVKRPACIVAGGETTVKVRGKGRGGRNQEFALSAAISMRDLQDVIMISCATDGRDGQTEAAGGIVDSHTIERGNSLNLKAIHFLDENDSHTYLQKVNDLIVTGPTGTNVSDLMITLIF